MTDGACMFIACKGIHNKACLPKGIVMASVVKVYVNPSLELLLFSSLGLLNIPFIVFSYIC